MATTEVWNDKSGPAAGENRVAPRRALGQVGRIADRNTSTKGKQVYVEGRLQTRQWDDKDGNKRYTTEIRGDRIVLLGGGGRQRRRRSARRGRQHGQPRSLTGA